MAEAEVLAEMARIAVELGLPLLEPDAELQRDLALDSLALLSLVVAVEDRFRVALHEEDAAEIRTARQLAALVLRRQQEAS